MGNKVGAFVRRSVAGPLSFGADGGTSVLVAVLAERGPINVPTLITSFSRYKTIFGGALSDTIGLSSGYLTARIMFEKGVRRMWVTRIVGSGALSALVTILDRAGTALPTMSVTAKGPGVWANAYKIKIEDGTVSGTFKLSVLDASDVAQSGEVFDNLTMNDASFEKVKNGSSIINVSQIVSATVGALKLPAAGTFLLTTTQAGVDDHAPVSADIVGTETAGVKSGLKVFRNRKFGLSFLIAPDLDLEADPRSEMLGQTDEFYHIPEFSGPPIGSTAVQAIADVVTAQSTSGGGYNYPRALVLDETTGNIKKIGVQGHVVADWLQAISTLGPGKAPAGKDFRVNFVLGLETHANGEPLVDASTAELLVGAGVNPVYDRNGQGAKVWGARSTADNNDWTYLHTGYIWALISSRVQDAIDELVYDIADPNFFNMIEVGVNNFMGTLFDLGAFSGTLPPPNVVPDGSKHAFSAKCSEDLLSDQDKADNNIRVEIWFNDAITAETILINVAKRNKG